jgi:hypothetical protein
MVSLITGSGIHHSNPLLPCRRAAAESEDVIDAALLVFSKTSKRRTETANTTGITIQSLCK